MFDDVDRRIIYLSVARAVESFGVSFLIIILPIYIASDVIQIEALLGNTLFGVSFTEELLIGIALSATALVSSVLQPFGGRLSDLYGQRKNIVLVGLLLLTVTLPLYLIVDSYEFLVLLRLVQGLSGALIIPSAASLVNDIASESSIKGESFGIFNSLRLVGFGLGPFVAGSIISFGPYSLLVTLSGVEAAFMFGIVTSLLSLFIVLFFVTEPDSTAEEKSDAKEQNLTEILTNQSFRPILVLGLGSLLMAASIAVFATLENAINTRLNQTSLLFGLQFSTAILANVIGQPLIGRYSDQYGRKLFLLVGFVILIPAITVQGFVTTPIQMIIARLFQGVAVACVFAPSLALAGEIAKKGQSGVSISVLTASFGFGIAIGPVTSGFLYSLGTLSTPFIFSGVSAVLGLVLVFIFVPED